MADKSTTRQRWTSLQNLNEQQRRQHVRALQRESYRRKVERLKSSEQPDQLTTIAAIDLAYIAGIIDGEGTICCLSHAKGKTCYPAVSVSMSDFGVIQWLAEKWGVKTSALPPRALHYRPQIFVRLSGARARLLCRLLLPYLKVKHRQAELVQSFPLEARLAPGVKIIGSELNARRFRLRDEINGLNHKPRNATYRRGDCA